MESFGMKYITVANSLWFVRFFASDYVLNYLYIFQKLSEDVIDKFGSQVPSGIRFLVSDGSLVSRSFDSGNGTIRGL